MFSLAPACFALPCQVSSVSVHPASCWSRSFTLSLLLLPQLSLSPSPSSTPSLAARFSSVPHRACRPSFGQPPFTMPTAGINSFRYYFARQALTFSIRLIKLFFSSAQCLSRLPHPLVTFFFPLCRMRRGAGDACIRMCIRACVISWQLITMLLMCDRNYEDIPRVRSLLCADAIG